MQFAAMCPLQGFGLLFVRCGAHLDDQFYASDARQECHKTFRLFLQARADDAGVLRLLRRHQTFAFARVEAYQVSAHVVEVGAALVLMRLQGFAALLDVGGAGDFLL